MATPTNLEMIAGDDQVFTATVTLAGIPVNLTGCDIWFSAKRDPSESDSQAIISISTITGEITIPDPMTGIALIKIPSGDTKDLGETQTKLWWDCKLHDVTNSTYTLAIGLLTINASITRGV